jgi:DNA polymerase III delta prime subunit
LVFLYYEELKAHIKKLKTQLKSAKKRKEQKKLKQQIAHSKLLAKFIDEDYEETRKKLKSMLKAGNITYDLSWALYKPNTIAYTPTYGNKDDPRAFRVDMTYNEEDFLGNEKLVIEGRYLEYDGKIFGMGDHAVRIPSFKGPRKIANLEAYPLKYHKDPEGLEKQLVERGKKFVALQGMNYRVQSGLGYMKQKRSVARINIDGRVMVDPAIFRRINPNYQLSYIKQDEVGADSDSGSCSDCDNDSDVDSESEQHSGSLMPKRLIMWKDKKGRKHLIPVPAGDNPDAPAQKLESIEKDDSIQHTFTEEELLIASPVVLGFAFSEKHWLEFSLLGIREIEWNQEAFSSLVLQPQYKQNLKGLVSSHRFNAAKTIDDVIQGKGKGMVVVLHGPPGVGKTLTAESIAEFLRCPLYMVSAGELGTNSRSLEIDLNRIMDITHSWGAILLIDEADVFMEARQAHDIHRNSLVSVFLRLLEYYQGILFLTTNRVATFDEAFQSRIHMGIRYEELTQKARMEIWKHHIGKVVNMEGQESTPFSDADIEELARKVLNGRQIKNTVKTAQSIALSEKEKFGIGHVRRVMEVQEDFQEDMRGGRSALAHYA